MKGFSYTIMHILLSQAYLALSPFRFLFNCPSLSGMLTTLLPQTLGMGSENRLGKSYSVALQ